MKVKSRKRVVMAMSGGVDSSVAAALLVEQGYEVIGMTMNLFSLPREFCRAEDLRSCCGWKSAEDAQRVALTLGIPHYVADFRRDFEKKVIADFCAQYSRGRTPNPCIRCNKHIKFELFLRKAKRLGAEAIATGHHARVEHDAAHGQYLLRKGKDKEKDQSYFLYPLTQKQLSLTLMPIGKLMKIEVRKIAQDLGLPVAQKSESQEICFVPDKKYARFLKGRIPEGLKPGPIVDLSHHILGQHRGIIHYTVGQRKGMGIAAPHPLYVLSIDVEKNEIIVGPNEKLYKSKLLASQVNFISGEKLVYPLVVKAKIRYRHLEAKAVVTAVDKGQVCVEFEKPQRAITPGQSVAFYDGDRVVGGAIIDSVLG
jgi:tRNA-specific 2-thiouridylase